MIFAAIIATGIAIIAAGAAVDPNVTFMDVINYWSGNCIENGYDNPCN